jgi:hypothetical protein
MAPQETAVAAAAGVAVKIESTRKGKRIIRSSFLIYFLCEKWR